MCSNLQRGTNKKVIASPFVHLMKYDNGNKCYHHLCWQCSQCWRTPGHFFFIITRINSSKKILNKIQNCNTLFETFIFCPKIKLSFPEKIVDFLGGKMWWFWTFWLLTTLISREKLSKKFDFSNSVITN